MTVIMRPSAAFDIFCNTVAPALYGPSVKKGESIYAGKIGQQVAASGLTLMDDGTFNKGLNTYAMDEEGYPSQKNVLMENGVLKMFLYDEFSAIESGTKPTGNAMHAERMDSSTTYRSLPTTCARNLILKGETVSEEEMIKNTRNGDTCTGRAGSPHVKQGQRRLFGSHLLRLRHKGRRDRLPAERRHDRREYAGNAYGRSACR